MGRQNCRVYFGPLEIIQDLDRSRYGVIGFVGGVVLGAVPGGANWTCAAHTRGGPECDFARALEANSQSEGDVTHGIFPGTDTFHD